MLKSLAFLCGVMVLAGCSSVQVDDYAGNSPRLDPQQFFAGRLSAHGVIKNRGGKVTRYFNADIKAYWEDGVGTLEEDFVFDDGETQRRVWTLSPDDEGGYVGTAGDVVGSGTLRFAGNSIFLDYVLRVAYGDGSIDLRVDDRMYLVQENMLVNESRMSKFGVDVGSILLVIVRHPQASV